MNPTNRRELIQVVINTIKAQTYLEIGIADGYTFNYISCSIKTSVDPNQNATYKVTSDEFFKTNQTKFDVIFIDGYHEKEQVIRDMNNSINALNPKGVIVTHDTLPLNPCQTYNDLCWSAWEAFAHLRRTNSNIFMASVILSDDPVGNGIIRHGSQALYPKEMPKGWAEYTECRDALMNVLPLEQVIANLSI